MRFDDWESFMAEQRRSGLLRRISDFVTTEREKAAMHKLAPNLPRDSHFQAIYPPSQDVFNFTLTPLRDVKVVILGQDPYHGPGQAHGLAFSVPEGMKIPPSLVNIVRELWSDEGQLAISDRIHKALSSRKDAPLKEWPRYFNGDLTAWTQQGVLLLNTALTVRQADAGSHLDAWQPFTDEVVRAVVDSADVAPHFVLWGAHARRTFERCVGRLDSGMDHCRVRSKTRCIGSAIITATYSPHPSPLSADRGFFGSRPFSRANLALRLNNPGRDCQVEWRLP